ncbi:hypothetical protein [Nocardioides currus]|uniref:Uncharacterized protein n=1 Tax=Nocardioides currus TaxID=2133958 RepID=A0A2R7YWL6_9ACTN|nr:hypothetical protein [Nocardioides currus]PUA80762.1 hypothetical protein C7S10_13540 [Nocardioides currus]
MNILLMVLVRIAALGAAIAVWSLVAPGLLDDDSGLGTGLLAFLGLAVVGLVWGLYDGRHRGFVTAAAAWSATALTFSVGWLVIRAVLDADSSMSASEIVSSDLSTIPFIAGLVLAPALVGAAAGHAVRPSQVA